MEDYLNQPEDRYLPLWTDTIFAYAAAQDGQVNVAQICQALDISEELFWAAMNYARSQGAEVRFIADTLGAYPGFDPETEQ
jgi:hypothetical protein